MIKFGGDRYQLLNHIPKHLWCAEVGVAEGHYADQIFTKTKPAKLFLIDQWRHIPAEETAAQWVDNMPQEEHDRKKREVFTRFEAPIVSQRVVVLEGDSVVRMRELPQHCLDWIYIDANHTKDAVARDLRAALHCVDPLGMIVGHDYLARDHGGDYQPYGVVEAVGEFLKEFPDYRHVLLTAGPDPTYVLSRRKAPLVRQLLESIGVR